MFCSGTSTRRMLALAERRRTSWATTTRARSRTTGRTRSTSCSRTTCSSRTRRGACRSTSSWSRAGRRSCTQRGRSDELRRTRSRHPGSPPGEPQNPTGAMPRLRVDRPHVPPAQAPRELALLRRQRAPSPTAPTTRCSAAPVPQNANTPGIWNPLPYFDTVQAGRPARRTSRRSTNFYTAAQAGHAAGRLVGHAGRGGERASAGARHARAGVRDEPDQRGHAQPGLELDRDLPSVGRLGRLLRPRRAAARRRATATAARARARDQPVREARATSTTRC